MAYNVDVDMFAKAMSFGLRDGMALGSTFSNFSNALVKGFDDQQKYDTEEQQQAIRQNTIEQQPVANRIQEAQAVAQEAKVAVIKADPEGYLKNQQLQMEAENAKNQEIIELQRQQNEFQQVISSGDGAAQADAIMSGKYNLFLSRNKEIKEQTVASTVGNWPEEAQTSYQQQKIKQLNQQNLIAQQEAIAKKFPDLQNDYNSNAEVKGVAASLGITPEELATTATVQRMLVAPLIQKTIEETYKDVDGKEAKRQVLAPPNPDGSVQYMRDPEADPSKRQVKDVLVHNGQVTTYELSPDTAKIINNYGYAQKVLNGNLSGMSNGDNLDDIQKSIKSAKARREAEAARQAVAIDPKEAESNMASFYAGATPRYQAAAQQVQAEAQAQNAAVQYRRDKAKQPTVQTAAQPEAASTPGVTWAARSGAETGAAAIAKVQYSPTPVPPGMSAAPSAPAASQSAPGMASTPVPEMIQSKLDARAQANAQVEALRKAKANTFMQARKVSPEATAASAAATGTPTASPTPLAVPPGVEAEIPAMTPLTREAPRTEAIARVAAMPEVADLGAIAKAIIVTESAGNRKARSPTDVIGIAQVIETTANGMVKGSSAIRGDPRTSALLGGLEIENLMTMPAFKGNPLIAITAYNAGPGTMRAAIKAADGSTEWNDILRVLPSVVTRLALKGEYGEEMQKNPQAKVDEVLIYADRVVANFPAFVATKKDMNLARTLKDLNKLRF